ncbi:MAG TPA: histone deacetylase [Anaerolineales bacterium]
MTTIFAYEPAFGHAYGDHPEHPDRLRDLAPLLATTKAERIAGRAATRDEICLIHRPALIDSIEQACRSGGAIIDLAPTFVTRTSLDDGLRAAGALLECTQRVVRRQAANAYAIVRPPGHHAEPDRAMGFCLFNNVAICAAAALKSGLKRVAIVDYDAHHGNGTQAAFANDERVGYLSTHQGGIYPGSGWMDEFPSARARIVNVPLPARAGNQGFALVLDQIIEPFIRAFKPEMLFVSAGFDAHWSDPLTALGLSSGGFHHLSQRLVMLAEELCGGRIVFALEGGYQPENVASGSAAVFAALIHEVFDERGDASPYAEPDVAKSVAAIRAFHGW